MFSLALTIKITKFSIETTENCEHRDHGINALLTYSENRQSEENTVFSIENGSLVDCIKFEIKEINHKIKKGIYRINVDIDGFGSCENVVGVYIIKYKLEFDNTPIDFELFHKRSCEIENIESLE